MGRVILNCTHVYSGRKTFSITVTSSSITPQYCASKGVAPWDLWITKVDFNTISNASEKFKDYATLGYSDYTNVSTTVNKGQTYPLSITPPLGWTGYFSNVYCRVWIDYNGNKTFEDNEKVIEGTNITLFSQNVLIPTTATTGISRMRVAMKWGSYPTACETFDKGEVEDYTLQITEATSRCNATNCPPNITVNTTTNSAIATWTEPTISGMACGGLVLIASIPPSTNRITSGATFPLGTSRVRYDVFNTSDGRIVDSSCHFDVTVVRNSANQPDLTLANLTIPTPSVQQGQTLNFYYDEKNIGTSNASGNFNIKSYLSVDQTWSADDYQNGSIGSGNYPAGLTQQVAASLTVNASVAAGNYYLIVKIDADNTISESNENNNVIISTNLITVTSGTSPQYCASKGVAPWDIWITKVDFNTISNASEKFKDYATLGYSDYTNVSTTVNKGQSYPLSITPPLGWTGYFANVFCRVWIDFNGNKSFEDNEKVIEGTNITLFSQNVLIPATATTGNACMRVAMKWGSYPTACETFDKGEVEDYTVQIAGGGQNLPDLTTNISFAAVATSQNPPYLTVNGKITNLNTTGANNVSIKVYISKDTIISADDKISYQSVFSFSSLPIPDSRDISYDLQTWTSGVGTFYLIAVADEQNSIAESNELNNKFIYRLDVQSTNSCRTQDSLQLVNLYNATNGANWTNKWNLTTPINTWYGVVLNANGCVQAIGLNANNLVGTLPNLNFANLIFLYLNDNRLSGTIPNFNLPQLTTLFLFNNQLSGAIPNLNLPNVKTLALNNNQLSGTIPNFNLPKLDVLSLSFNQLSGTIPNFNALPIITQMTLNNNQLSGALPNFNLKTLNILYLNNNQLSGTIPNLSLPALATFNLSNNLLSGNLPDLNVPAIAQLFLNNNNLSGCIPASYKAICARTSNNSSLSINISNNPNLATQDFTAYCSNNTGACGAATTTCKRFTASDVLYRCVLNCPSYQWKPFGLQIHSNGFNNDCNQISFNKTDGVTLTENSNGSATLTGTFRTPSWQPIILTIQLTATTSNNPTGGCDPFGSTTGWRFYTVQSGTLQRNGQTLPILPTQSPSVAYVGIGASGHNGAALGASMEFRIGTTGEAGGISVLLGNESACAEANLATQQKVLELEVHANLDKAELLWISNQPDADYFEVLKADAQGIFKTINILNKNSQANLQSYNYTDSPLTEGSNIYQIKAIKLDGSISLSQIKTVNYEKITDFSIFPNPTSEEAFIDLKSFENKTVELFTMDVAGKIIAKETIQQASLTPHRLSIANLKNGAYFIRIETAGKRAVVRKLQILK